MADRCSDQLTPAYSNKYKKVAILPRTIIKKCSNFIPMKILHQSTYQLIGDNIKRLRKEQGLSQEELANRCERIDRSKISDIENAKEDFMFSTLLEICVALKQDLSVVCSFPPPKSSHD